MSKLKPGDLIRICKNNLILIPQKAEKINYPIEINTIIVFLSYNNKKNKYFEQQNFYNKSHSARFFYNNDILWLGWHGSSYLKDFAPI